MELKKLSNNLIKFLLLSLLIIDVAHSREIENVLKSMTSLKDPLGMRDPFQPPPIQRSGNQGAGTASTEQINGIYSNIPALGNMPIQEVRVVGVIIGPERRAFVRKNNNDPTTYVVRENDELGGGGARVRAILPGGMILVEKVTNIYGEEEYLETVIPLSK